MNPVPMTKALSFWGITKAEGSFVGTPNKNEVLQSGDTLMVYGSEEAVDKMAHPEQ